MTDFSRLMDYIHDYFPEPIYSSQEVRDWAMANVPAWKDMKSKTQDMIIDDWENFIMPQVEQDITEVRERIGEKSQSFWDKVVNFVKRLFRRH